MPSDHLSALEPTAALQSREPVAKPAAQSRGKRTQQLRSSVGILYDVQTENGWKDILLRTPTEAAWFLSTVRTLYQGFDDARAWNYGATWVILYDVQNVLSGGKPLLKRAAFTRRIVASIRSAARVVEEYQRLLAGRNYKEAYALLNASAQKSTPYDAFVKMYKDLRLACCKIRICSHSDQRVSILQQHDGQPSYQLCEVASKGTLWYIDRLFPVSSTPTECALK